MTPETKPETKTEEKPETKTVENDESAKLGEGGVKALESERAARKTADQRTKDLESEIADLRKKGMSEQELAVAEAREAGMLEARSAFAAESAAVNLTAAAVGILSDPSDAPLLLANSKIDAGDPAAVKTALEALVKAKPYLAAQAAPSGLPGGGSSGAQGGSDLNAWLRGAS